MIDLSFNTISKKKVSSLDSYFIFLFQNLTSVLHYKGLNIVKLVTSAWQKRASELGILETKRKDIQFRIAEKKSKGKKQDLILVPQALKMLESRPNPRLSRLSEFLRYFPSGLRRFPSPRSCCRYFEPPHILGKNCCRSTQIVHGTRQFLYC